jgi:hypothetical protein
VTKASTRSVPKLRHPEPVVCDRPVLPPVGGARRTADRIKAPAA